MNELKIISLDDEDVDITENRVDSATHVDEINTNKMLRALSAIALEMQKFHASTPVSYHNFGDSQELSDKLSICKSSLRLKRKQIRLLKQNLRSACVVAKTVMSAKEKETISLHNHINSARSDLLDLYQKNIVNSDTIQTLTSKNDVLSEKIKNLDEFIELGYQELVKMQDTPAKNLPTALKLKEIMVSCGQYYADYTNEYNARMQLEQKNRFLSNKIKILVNNLEAVAEEIKNLRYQNSRLQKENSLLKRKQIDNSSNNVTNPFVQENIQINQFKTDIVVDHNFDLTSHLTLVKDLLSNQDNMLKDLKKLSEKLKIDPKIDTLSFSSTSTI